MIHDEARINLWLFVRRKQGYCIADKTTDARRWHLSSNGMRRTSGDRNFSLVGTRPLIADDLGMKLYELLEGDVIRAQFKRLYQDEPPGAGGLEPYSPPNMYVH